MEVEAFLGLGGAKAVLDVAHDPAGRVGTSSGGIPSQHAREEDTDDEQVVFGRQEEILPRQLRELRRVRELSR